MRHNNAQGQVLRLTKIHATDRATKQHSLIDAKVVTDSAPQVYAGTGEVLTLPPTLDAFADVLCRLAENQCLLYGIPSSGVKEFELTTKAKRAAGDSPNRIARERASITWPEGLAVLMLDHDAGDGGTCPPEEVVRALVKAAPALDGQRFLFWPSSSSYLRDRDEGELRGLRGFHLYILIEGSAIPAVVAHLREALAAAGYIRFEVSASGALLERAIVDFSVFQPERIDYAAPPVCKNGIEAFGRESRFIGGDRDILPPGDWTIPREMQQAAERNRAAARASREPQALAVRAARIEDDAARQREIDATIPEEVARERAEAALETGDLYADFPIVVFESERKSTVTVREVCADPKRFQEAQTLDPIEPAYRGHKIVGIVYFNGDGSTVLHSQAHGGRTYRLHGRPTLTLREGKLESAVEEAVRLMTETGFYNFGGRAAIIGGGGLVPLGGVALNHEIERRIEVNAYKRPRGRPSGSSNEPRLVPVNLPREFGERITSNARLVGQLPTLIGVRRDPLLWPDGRYVNVRGYDQPSQLWFEVDEPSFVLPDASSDSVVQEAFGILMAPFRDYKFSSDRDRSALLLALLTAVCRLALPLAPAFTPVAPMRGSGKTSMSIGVATLSGTYELIDVAGNPDEADKRVDTFLMGDGVALVLDNLVTGDELSRPAFASMLTAEFKSIRRYGSNTVASLVSTRRFVIGNANNPRITGDGVRRVVLICILPASATPHLEKFNFDPVQRVKETRQDMMQAALLLLRAGIGTPAGATLGSFETWAQFVGGALERCRAAGVEGLAAFSEVLGASVGEDPTAIALCGFMDAFEKSAREGVTPNEAGQTVTDGFGRRSNTGHGVVCADALEALAQSAGFSSIWKGTGTYNAATVGRLFGSLNGVLFEHEGRTWRCSYPPGRQRAFRIEAQR